MSRVVNLGEAVQGIQFECTVGVKYLFDMSTLPIAYDKSIVKAHSFRYDGQLVRRALKPFLDENGCFMSNMSGRDEMLMNHYVSMDHTNPADVLQFQYLYVPVFVTRMISKEVVKAIAYRRPLPTRLLFEDILPVDMALAQKLAEQNEKELLDSLDTPPPPVPISPVPCDRVTTRQATKIHVAKAAASAKFQATQGFTVTTARDAGRQANLRLKELMKKNKEMKGAISKK